MKAYETSATVGEQGRVQLSGLPFAPGTQVDVVVSPVAAVAGTVAAADEQAVAAARVRMQELFRTIHGFRLSPKVPREALYDRGVLR